MKSLLLIICLFCAHPLLAYDHPLSVSELVEIALQNSPETKKAWSEAKRADASLGVAKSKYYPTLKGQLQVDVGRQYKDLNGPTVHYSEERADLTLSMILFDFGERASSLSAAKSALEAANWESDFAIQKVLVAVLEDTYLYLHAEEQHTGALATQEDAKTMLAYAKGRYEAGLAPITDLHTSKATYAEMQMEVAKAQQEVETKKGKLAQTLAMGPEAAFDVAPIDKLPQPKAEELEQLLQCAKQKHTEILAQQAKIQESLSTVDKVESSFLPKLSTNAKAGVAHYGNDHTKNGTWSVGFDIQVPLFSGFESLYEVKKARAEHDTSIAELATIELGIAQEVLASRSALKAAQEMLHFAEDNVKSSDAAYHGTLEKYRSGQKKAIFEVSSALQQLAKARVRLHNVKTQWLVSLAKLAYATGTLEPQTL